MTEWEINKSITFILALILIITPLFYAAFLIGTLAHELNHAKHSTDMTLIKINYNMGGEAYGHFTQQDSEANAYLVGSIVTGAVLLIVTFAGFIVLENIKRCRNEL